MTVTAFQKDEMLFHLRNKFMADGYIRMAKRRPSKEEIADMALSDWGLGSIFDLVVEQLGLVWEDVEGSIVYKNNPQRDLEKSKALEQYKCASFAPPFEENPDLLNKSLDELLDELKSCQEVYGIDGEHDPIKIQALLWTMCYQIASVMKEDHCDLLQEAAYAIAYQHKTHPTAVLEWKDAGMKMCDRVLNAIHKSN